MGKVEDMRALKQERLAAQAATRTAAPAPVRAPARTSPGSTAAPRVPAEASPTGQLCGHRSIGNKSCTRPAGHTEKNHRYASAEPRTS